MRIKYFNKLIENETITLQLNDSTVVIDAQNYFYKLYKESGCLLNFGCESDKFVKFLKGKLNMFKKSKVTCYFMFKGGHEDINKSYKEICYSRQEYGCDPQQIRPIFTKDIIFQVLDEMGFKYVVCEIEAKEQCIALAHKLDCPVMSYDIELCFAGIKYIPSISLIFDEQSNTLRAEMFTLENFLRKFKLTEEKLAIFAVLNDLNHFPEHHFRNFYESLKIPLGLAKRYLALFRVLSSTNTQKFLEQIFKYNKNDKDKFLQLKTKVLNMTAKRITPGLPCQHVEGKKIGFSCEDPNWFEKGVITKNIPLIYAKVYKHGKIFGSWMVTDESAPDALTGSLEIVKYAYDLLTNFDNEGLSFVTNNNKITVEESLKKPDYTAVKSVFENGCAGIRSLKLFEHFLIETIPGCDLSAVSQTRPEARLLIVALGYFARSRPDQLVSYVYSVLLCYVCMGLASEESDDDEFGFRSLAINEENVTQLEKAIIQKFYQDYSTVTSEQAENIFDGKLIHPLVEFQHIFDHINCLNKLCGRPYSPTVYGKTYNGTFVYKTLLVFFFRAT